MKLLGTTSSPFVRKIRIVALEKQLPLEFVIDNPLQPGTAVPALNPLGKVPTLVRDDGVTLIDSPLIAEYLDSLGESPRLIPAVQAERTAVRQWEAIADGVLDAAVLIRMESLRPESERSAGWIERQRERIERALDFMNRELGARAFCACETFTLADIALGCCMGYLQFRFAEQSWHARFSNLARAAAQMERRASFHATPMA